MRISDWSSDVCSSDLDRCGGARDPHLAIAVLDFDFGQPRRVEHLGELAHEIDIDTHVIVFAIGHLDPFPCQARLLSESRRRFKRERVRHRSEERRVGKAWVSTGKFRWSPYH